MRALNPAGSRGAGEGKLKQGLGEPQNLNHTNIRSTQLPESYPGSWKENFLTLWKNQDEVLERQIRETADKWINRQLYAFPFL